MFRIFLPLNLVLVIVLSSSSLAQVQHHTIKWQGIKSIEVSEGQYKNQLIFTGALNMPQFGEMPVFSDQLKIGISDSVSSVSILNPVYEPFEDDISGMQGTQQLAENINISSRISWERKSPVFEVIFCSHTEKPL